MVQSPSQGLSHVPSALTAHRRTHRSSRCAHHTTCSCLMTPCESPSCWKLGWQTPPQGLCGHAEHREGAQQESSGTARSQPCSAEQDGDVQSALHTHTGLDDFRESRSSLLSCLAFSLASAFSSFLAFTIWDTEWSLKKSEHLQQNPQKPSSVRKKINQPLKPGRKGGRKDRETGTDSSIF